MITVNHLTKRYGSHLAVDDISFTVQDGEIVGFLGPNGAGKSTTMNMLTGYISSSSGEALINDINILDNPIQAKREIGYLPELPPLYQEMTVMGYLRFVYDLKKCKLPRKAHLTEICNLCKISDVQDRIIKNLSKGYRQRVGLAQALVGNPPILILDEPTVGLDPKQMMEIRNLIKRLGKRHTVILSSHILSEIQAVCDRVIIINKGKLMADGAIDTLAQSCPRTTASRYGWMVQKQTFYRLCVQFQTWQRFSSPHSSKQACSITKSNRRTTPTCGRQSMPLHRNTAGTSTAWKAVC